MAGSKIKLEIRDVRQSFEAHDGTIVTALDGINLSIPENRFISLLGPSGCGKSTIFNIIAGLISPGEGDIYLDSEKITNMIGFVGYMLQKDLLLPWRTVLDNVILGMELQGTPKSQARERAHEYFDRYGLGGFEKQYPAALSGGMRQRAALLRTLLYDCDVILLDEPFGALDAQTRAHMQEWLLQIWTNFDKTVVFVTHDVEEAVYLSDEIFVMTARPGRIKEIVDVPIGRPRPRSAVEDEGFRRIKRRCLDILAEELGTEDVASTDLECEVHGARQT